MAARWSNPSGGIGVHRFMVWPLGSDSYSHTDLTNNFDEADNIIGQPSDASQWPPSLGLDGGIYKEIRLLQLDRTPIGTVTPWFRPSASVPIPTGWVACDGSVVAAADHDFPGIAGDVTLPDLRNAFVLGADSTLAQGAAAADVSSGDLDNHLGAPGEGATGGSHKIIQTIAQMAAHDHGGFTGFHNHGGATGQSSKNVWTENEPQQQTPSVAVANNGMGIDHTHSIASDRATISSQGSGSPMDNRPRYVGLIYLAKVKFVDAI